MNIETYGIDLLKIIIEAKENNNEKFATLIEKQVYNLQKTYDVIAEKLSSVGDKDLWNIDSEYLEGMLKK